jgi:hypothetical protein
MPKYKCLNAECAAFNQEVTSPTTIRFVKGVLVDSAEECPVCKERRIPIPEDGMTTFMHGSPNICKR